MGNSRKGGKEWALAPGREALAQRATVELRFLLALRGSAAHIKRAMKFLHLADLHLDTLFACRAAELRKLLRAAARQALVQAVDVLGD